MNNKIIIISALIVIFIAGCLAYTIIATNNTTDNANTTDIANNTTTRIAEVAEDENYKREPQSQEDEGAFYSAQHGRTIYTGEITTMDGEHYYKHDGYNQWSEITLSYFQNDFIFHKRGF